jgi:hypothetical protein
MLSFKRLTELAEGEDKCSPKIDGKHFAEDE